MRKIAFLVGNDTFPNDPSIPPLRFTQNDASELGKILANQETCAFETKLYLNKTSQKVLADLEHISGELEPDDTPLFYYAGHGKLRRDGQLCLVSHDTTMTNLGAKSIRAREVLNYLQESHARRRVLILDCCQSGAIGRSFRGDDLHSSLAGLADSFGSYILTASTAIQFAEEREKDGHGVFTKALIDCLRDGGKESITVNDWYEYAYRRLMIVANQTPLKWGLQEEGPSFEIATFKVKYEREHRERQRKRLKTAREKLLPLVDSGHLTKTKFDKAMQLLEADDVAPWEHEVRSKLERYADGENFDLVDLFAPSVIPPYPLPKVESPTLPPVGLRTPLGLSGSFAGSEGVNGNKIPEPNKPQPPPIVPEKLKEPPEWSDFDKHVPPVKKKSTEDDKVDTLRGVLVFQCITLLAKYLIQKSSQWKLLPVILGSIGLMVDFSDIGGKITFTSVKQVTLLIFTIGAFCLIIYLCKDVQVPRFP